MTDLVMRKRAGRAGEVGLFIDVQVFEEDFGHIKMDAEVKAVVTAPRSLRQLKFAWSLATKIADGCDWVETKEDAMDFMLIEARHFRRIFDPIRNIAILKPKPTNFSSMDGTDYTRLLKRIVHVAVTIMIPGMDDKALIAEIEAMIGPDLPEPAPKARKAKKPDAPAAAQPEASEKPEGGQDTAEASEDLEPETSPPDRPGAPTNEAEYVAACRSWLRKQTERLPSFDYYNAATHRQMRIDLKVSTGVRKQLEREIGEFFDAKDREGKAAAKA